MFQPGKKVICIAGVKMKGKLFTVENVFECKCKRVKLQIVGINLIVAAANSGVAKYDACACENCHRYILGIIFFDAKHFRPVDETFAEDVLKKAHMEAMKESLPLFIETYFPDAR